MQAKSLQIVFLFAMLLESFFANSGELQHESENLAALKELEIFYQQLGIFPRDSDVATAQVLLEKTVQAFAKLKLDPTFVNLCQKAGELTNFARFSSYFSNWQELSPHEKAWAIQQLFSHIDSAFYEAAKGTPEEIVFAPNNRFELAIADKLPPQNQSLMTGILPADKYFLQKHLKGDFEAIKIIPHYAQEWSTQYYTYLETTKNSTTRSGAQTIRMGYFTDSLAPNPRHPLGEILYLPALHSPFWQQEVSGTTVFSNLLEIYFHGIYYLRMPRFFTLQQAAPKTMPFYNLARLRGHTLEDYRRPFFASYQAANEIYSAAITALQYYSDRNILLGINEMKAKLPAQMFVNRFLQQAKFQQTIMLFQQKAQEHLITKIFSDRLKLFHRTPSGGFGMYHSSDLLAQLTTYFGKQLNSGVGLTHTDLQELEAAYQLYHNKVLLADETGLRNKIFQEIMAGRSVAREIKIVTLPTGEVTIQLTASSCLNAAKKLK